MSFFLKDQIITENLSHRKKNASLYEPKIQENAKHGTKLTTGQLKSYQQAICPNNALEAENVHRSIYSYILVLHTKNCNVIYTFQCVSNVFNKCKTQKKKTLQNKTPHFSSQ